MHCVATNGKWPQSLAVLADGLAGWRMSTHAVR